MGKNPAAITRQEVNYVLKQVVPMAKKRPKACAMVWVHAQGQQANYAHLIPAMAINALQGAPSIKSYVTVSALISRFVAAAAVEQNQYVAAMAIVLHVPLPRLIGVLAVV